MNVNYFIALFIVLINVAWSFAYWCGFRIGYRQGWSVARRMREMASTVADGEEEVVDDA